VINVTFLNSNTIAFTEDCKVIKKIPDYLGILLNFFHGFRQADPIAAIIIAAHLIEEGTRTLRE